MLGDRIRLLRENRKMGVNETAEIAGISGSYLSTIENGIKNNPSMETLSKIAEALGVTVDEFFREELIKNDIEEDFKPTLSIKEQVKLDGQATEVLDTLKVAFSQNKGYLEDADYEIIGATIRTLLEQMAKKNKEKYTPKAYRKNKKEND